MISACFITLNEEKNIEKVFKHLKGVVDEFVVVDDGSTDDTVNICKKYTNNITIMSSHGDFASRRNFAIKKASNPWILMIDPDERCSQKLLKKIHEMTQGEYDAYKVHWKNYCGKKLICNPWKTILFKKHAVFGGEIHERIINIEDKHVILDKEIYITHKKTLKEQLRHLTLYRKIILNLDKDSKGKDRRLPFLIEDHNSNVNMWLGIKYDYLLINK